jgi:hypothetical protein
MPPRLLFQWPQAQQRRGPATYHHDVFAVFAIRRLTKMSIGVSRQSAHHDKYQSIPYSVLHLPEAHCTWTIT